MQNPLQTLCVFDNFKVVKIEKKILKIIPLFLLGVLLLLAGLLMAPFTPIFESQIENSASVEETEEIVENVSFVLTEESFSDILNSNSPKAFSLDEEVTAPSLNLSKLNALIDEAKEWGDVSLLALDIETGAGIGYNIDEKIYGASSFKAPYCLYICEMLVETGKVDLKEPLSTYYNYETIGEHYIENILEITGDYWLPFELSVEEYMRLSIEESNNVAYITLRQCFDGYGYENWIKEFNVDDTGYDLDTAYPEYGARSSAKLWFEMYEYFNKGSATSELLKEFCANAQVSFMVDALPEDVSVYQKAGWIALPDLNSTSDAGLVVSEGKTYIISVMTSMPSYDVTQEIAGEISAELFDLVSYI